MKTTTRVLNASGLLKLQAALGLRATEVTINRSELKGSSQLAEFTGRTAAVTLVNSRELITLPWSLAMSALWRGSNRQSQRQHLNSPRPLD